MRRACLMALILVLACCARPAPRAVEDTRQILGERVTVRAWGGTDPEGAVERAFAEAEELGRLLDDDDPGSQIAAVGRGAGRTSVEVDPRVMELLQETRKWWHASRGALDPTIRPLLELWGIPSGDGPGYYGPAHALVERALAKVGMDKVILNDIGGDVRLERPGMALDVGAVAPGYIVDRMIGILRDAGVTAALVDGGDVVRVFGSPPEGGAWKIEVPHPRDPERVLTVLELEEGAVAWSLDAKELVFIPAIQEYFTHIVDPRTGEPVKDTVMVVIVAQDAFTADALSTAAMVMGRGDGGILVRDTPGAEAIFIDRDPSDAKELRAGATAGLRGGKIDVDL